MPRIPLDNSALGKKGFKGRWGENKKMQTELMLLLPILERHLCVLSKMIAGLLISLGECLFCLVV